MTNWLVMSMTQSPWGWGLFIIIGVALIRVWPQIKKLTIDEHTVIRQEYQAELGLVKAEVIELRKEMLLLREQNLLLRVENERLKTLPCNSPACPVHMRIMS